MRLFAKAEAPVWLPPSPSSSGWIGFKMPEEGRYIVLPIRLNGQDVEALLDSGVQGTVLDKGLASRLGLPVKDRFTAVGVSGLGVAARTEALTISIGNLVLTVPQAAIVDLAPINVATARPIVAILGQDVFDRYVVDIDFESRRIAFMHPDRSVAPLGVTCVPLMKGDLGRRGVPLSVEGHPVPANFGLRK